MQLFKHHSILEANSSIIKVHFHWYLALVDTDYKFTFVDIGNYGSQSDGAVFKHPNFGQKFINGELDKPRPKALPNYPQGGVLPHCKVGDEAFPCHMDLMRPNPRGKG